MAFCDSKCIIVQPFIRELGVWSLNLEKKGEISLWQGDGSELHKF